MYALGNIAKKSLKSAFAAQYRQNFYKPIILQVYHISNPRFLRIKKTPDLQIVSQDETFKFTDESLLGFISQR